MSYWTWIVVVLLLYFNKLRIIQMLNVNGKKKVLSDDQVVGVIVENVWVPRVSIKMYHEQDIDMIRCEEALLVDQPIL